MTAEKITYYDLNSRVTVLETHYQHVDKQLTEIKDTVDDICKNMGAISDKISSHAGASAARHRIWTLILGIVGGIGALGLHTVIFKFFGFNI